MKVVLITSILWVSVGLLYVYLTELSDVNIWNNEQSSQEDHMIVDSMKAPPRFIHQQPHWAYKYKFMEQPDNIPDDKRICFVHVGKTAGSTLACYFGFDYGQCSNGENTTSSLYRNNNYNQTAEEEIVKNMIPTGLLSHYTTSMIHKQYDSCLEDIPISIYLFVVRNPFERIKSWFEYERPNKYTTNKNSWSYLNQQYPLFVECKYNTLNDLGGKKGLGANNNTLCSRRAFRAITGITGYIDHNKYNYEYYYKKVLYNHIMNNKKINKLPELQQLPQLSNPRIVVIRTEHLEYDWNSIEYNILQSNHTLPNYFTFTHKNRSPKLLEDLYINEDSKQNICNALCNEIQYYKQILLDANNLNKKDYIIAMKELEIDCPIQTTADTC